MRTPTDQTTIDHWEPLLPHREEVLIEDLELFDQFMVVNEREQGLSRLRVIRRDKTADYHIPMEEETYTLYISYNPDFKSTNLRYVFNSLITPSTVIELSLIHI